jgi:two-component system, cell cycle sensor histidine kinase and response regulator CckA
VDAETVILLVEDDPAHAELARRALENGAGAFSLVETLREARAWLKNCYPDLVVCDLHLPDGSAIELLEEGGVPLVIMTSQGDEQRAVAAIKGGALDYVVKSPEMYRDLPLTISRALRAARAERERRRAEVSLRESEQRFRQLAENIAEAFWLYDIRENRMVYASPAWARIYGPTAAEVVTDLATWFDQMVPEDRHSVRITFYADAPLRPLVREYRVLADDRVRWIEERTFPVLDREGKPWRIAGLGADVTRRRELEAALRQSQKMEAVGQLAGGVAHDFNNMLTAIMASAEQVMLRSNPADQKELCDVIVMASERAAELTRKLLSFSRKGKLSTAPLDVHAVVRDTATLLERSIDRRVRVKLDLSAERPVVKGDATQLQNALLNLGINARDAMPDGGVLTIATADRHLDEAACAALPFDIAPGPHLELAVSDTGGGIPAAYISKVFEPFFTTKPVGHGTGLGLAAVYGTVVEHGGAVTVESKVARGSSFRLFLPISAERPSVAARSAEARPGSGIILLVDDEPLLRKVGSQLMRSLGYEVLVAKDGAEAVRIFTERHRELAAVVCDLVMPELSGADAIRQMKALFSAVPIVACSGYPHGDRVGASIPECDAFLPKPFHRAELAAALERATAPQK